LGFLIFLEVYSDTKKYKGCFSSGIPGQAAELAEEYLPQLCAMSTWWNTSGWRRHWSNSNCSIRHAVGSICSAISMTSRLSIAVDGSIGRGRARAIPTARPTVMSIPSNYFGAPEAVANDGTVSVPVHNCLGLLRKDVTLLMILPARGPVHPVPESRSVPDPEETLEGVVLGTLAPHAARLIPRREDGGRHVVLDLARGRGWGGG